MKRLILMSGLLFAIAFSNVQAQKINVNININSQPAWGPVGYDYARYYYFPDMDCYYDINASLFYFMNGGYWVSSRYLPPMYHHYNLYNLYKVVLNDYRPWYHHHNHRRLYAKYRGHHHNQVVIYKSKDHRYDRSRHNRYDWIAPEYRSNRKHNDKQYSGQQNNRYNNYNNKDRNTNNRYEKRNDKISKPYNSGRDSQNKKQNNRIENNSGRGKAKYDSNLRNISNSNDRAKIINSDRRNSGRH